jgi:hypothetical protein
MYDGHSDVKQFLMSYEATISSYGGNTAVIAKSFVMAVKNVAQTWYSPLRPGTITSWQKLKDMLITSFQGFQMKPVTAQALFQCTQDHEEYLQAYVRRFLRLRAQAPTVPNEIVIEAMIKGLRPGPMAQYFARKPPQTLEKLLQKMDEYIRADNDFRQRREEAYKFFEMTRGFGGRIHPRHVRSIHSSNQSDDRGSQFQRPHHSSQSSGQQQSFFRPPAQGAEAAGASEVDMGINPENSIAYSVVKTRATLQEHVRSPFRSKKRLPKQKRDRINRSRFYTLLRATLPTYQNIWAINLQLLLLRQVIHKLPGLSSHCHHHCHLLIPEASSQKGTSTPNSSAILGRSPKLVQSTTLYQSRSIYTEKYPTFDVLLSFMPFYFLCEKQVMKNIISISCNNYAYTRVKYIFLMDLRSSKDVSKGTK